MLRCFNAYLLSNGYRHLAPLLAQLSERKNLRILHGATTVAAIKQTEREVGDGFTAVDLLELGDRPYMLNVLAVTNSHEDVVAEAIYEVIDGYKPEGWVVPYYCKPITGPEAIEEKLRLLGLEWRSGKLVPLHTVREQRKRQKKRKRWSLDDYNRGQPSKS